MPGFSYVAINPTGKEVKGNIDAENRERAMEQLRADGLTPVTVDVQSLLNADISFSIGGKPKPRDLSVFCRQFVSIINAGVTIVDALEMLGEQTENKMLRRAIIDTKFSVETGESLADAMRPHDKVFPSLFITMMEAGEASGSLDVSLERMATQFEKEATLKAMMKKATIYPAVISVVAVGVVIGMLGFVIPTFEEMFAELGTELPAITKAVVAASDFVQSRWYVLLAIVLALVFGFKYYGKTEAGQYLLARINMKLPLFGVLTQKGCSAAMARTLSTLMAAGIPLISALEITSHTMTNIYYRDAILDTRNEVSMGSSIAEPLARSGVFPPLVHHMISIGEETGNIESMMEKLADYYDEEVKLATEALMAALEPAIIVVLALVVGTIVVAIISPMAAMYEGLDSL
ncbi:MAG: type II secretion system F family protein [Syntrophomonadaceae bacterium]|nr:type II secretion system F family protein [Syntrophomonadaceae bacterium]